MARKSQRPRFPYAKSGVWSEIGLWRSRNSLLLAGKWRFVHAGCGVNALSGKYALLQGNVAICVAHRRYFAFYHHSETGETRFFLSSFAIIRKNVKCLAVSTSRCCALSSNS
ncbi:hypothetical protein ACLK1T_14855 [Escherichia coli]